MPILSVPGVLEPAASAVSYTWSLTVGTNGTTWRGVVVGSWGSITPSTVEGNTIESLLSTGGGAAWLRWSSGVQIPGVDKVEVVTEGYGSSLILTWRTTVSPNRYDGSDPTANNAWNAHLDTELGNAVGINLYDYTGDVRGTKLTA